MQESNCTALPIYGDRPWSPYFVFIKRTDLSDREIVDRLEDEEFVEIKVMDTRLPYLGIGRDGQWTHICDNFRYSHWHSGDFRSRVIQLAEGSDIFTFSVGDTEMSFDLEYFKEGESTRRLIWDDPEYNGGFLKEEMGVRLSMEERIDRGRDPQDGLWAVAAALGIEIDYRKVAPRLYAPAHEARRPASRIRSFFARNRKA